MVNIIDRLQVDRASLFPVNKFCSKVDVDEIVLIKSIYRLFLCLSSMSGCYFYGNDKIPPGPPGEGDILYEVTHLSQPSLLLGAKI